MTSDKTETKAKLGKWTYCESKVRNKTHSNRQWTRYEGSKTGPPGCAFLGSFASVWITWWTVKISLNYGMQEKDHISRFAKVSLECRPRGSSVN